MGVRKRIYELDTLSNLGDDVFFAVDKEIAPGSYKTYKIPPENILISDHLSGYIQTPENRSYTLILYAPTNGILKRLTTVCAGGTFDLEVKIEGLTVTGMTSAVSSIQINRDSTGNNTFKGGDKIEFVITNSATSPRDFEFSLLMDIGIVLDYPA